MGWICILQEPVGAQQPQKPALHLLDMQCSFLVKTEVLLLFVGPRCRFGLRLGGNLRLRNSGTFGTRFSFLSSIITATCTTLCRARCRVVLLLVELLCVPVSCFVKRRTNMEEPLQ